MIKKTAQLVVLLTLVFVQVHAQTKPITAPIVQAIGYEYKLQSEVLKEERTLLIHIPKDYETSNKTYPVIYVLDGNSHFSHTVNASKVLTEFERMPESIIVGITNNNGTRGRDLAVKKDNFIKYIKEEVIPFVNKTYRTNNIKTLFGHSLGGVFTLNYLATEPNLFDNYIAASPVVQISNSELHTKFITFFNEKPSVNKSVYLTLTEASAEGMAAYNALNKFVDLLKKEAPKTLHWKYDFIENHVHTTTPYITIYNGLNLAFYDYQTPMFQSYQEYIDKGGMNSLKNYFAKRAQKYNVPTVITHDTMRMLANVMYGDQKGELALEILITNTLNHPNSIDAHNSLARLYVRLKQIDKAENTYKKIIQLAEQQKSPNSDYFKRQLIGLKETNY